MEAIKFGDIESARFVYNRVRGHYKAIGATHEGVSARGQVIFVRDNVLQTHLPIVLYYANHIDARFKRQTVDDKVTSSSL